MARLPRSAAGTMPDTGLLRLRAAWLYHAHGLTQKDIADRLGIARTTVIRLLEEARKRGEVRIWIDEGEGECVALGLALEERLGLSEAIVVPGVDGVEETARSVGLALGRFLSETIADGMTLGVGWGRTLTASLASFRPPRREGVRVVSLLGGVVEAQLANPMEYSWRLASLVGASCFFFPAPLLVDSEETRRRLIERCGLDRIETLAAGLDIAVISAGDVAVGSTSLSRGLISQAEARELVALGAVSDVMCNFLDAEGQTVDHPVNRRVMSVSPDTVARAGHVVLASGGAHRAVAIRAACRRFGCDTLVTDEHAARAMMGM